MKYILGIDFGGGASKALILSEEGKIIADNQLEYPTYHPIPEACEQAPEDWINVLCENIRSVISKSGISPSDIECVAVDSATHTSVVCDENYKPLRNAMHWTDTRSRKQADDFRERYGDYIFEKTFHKPDTIWTLCQLAYLKETEGELFEKIKYIFFEKDYIRFFLTGVFCTDFIEAEGTMFFDCNEMKWDEKLCKLAGITTDVLPPVVKPTDTAGYVTKAAAEATGLKEGTKVICGTTDTALEVFASGAVEEGDITVKLATAGRICVVTPKAYPDRHLVNYSHVVDGMWYPGTATKSAAASFRWYRDKFGGSYKELDEYASKIPIGCEGIIFLPYLNGELTPYADPMLCGSFTGIRQTHGKMHLTRAVLEGVSLSLLDSKKYLDSLGIKYKNRAVLIGGGVKSDLWSKITADVLGLTLIRTKNSDSSLGSAMLGGIACGIFRDPVEAVAKCVECTDEFVPEKENTEKYEKVFEEYKMLHDALAPVYAKRNK